ncbi:MAG: transporter [Saprospiraceae bacterium]|nr:transporter [Saprospiraceae bacterium]
MKRFVWISFFISSSIVWSSGQTCCSGGVPVSANLGMPAEASNILQISLTYDLNVLQTLKTGTEVLKDRNRKRTTHSVLFETGYSFTNRFSVDALFSWVRQERLVTNFGNRQLTSTDGVGDVTILVKYLALDKTSFSLTPGVGIKAPVGASDLLTTDGLTLSADLQPGSGAWDGIAWLNFMHQVGFRPGATITANVIYSVKGHNKDYLGVQDYKFGNEFQLVAGYGDRLLLGKQLLDPSILFRYRVAEPDENDGLDQPSTGGKWIFVNPSITLWFSPDLSWNANVELPLFANITGTQVTPSYRFNTGFYYKFNLSKKTLDL